MIRLLVAFCTILLLLPLTALAEIKTITHTVQQPFGGSQSPDDARTAGIARAKREALERFGTYIESSTVVKNSQVDSDEILALTAGVTKAEVVKQKNYTEGDAFGLEITVKVELDTAVLDQSLRRLLQSRKHLNDLKSAREREKQLLDRITELEKTNRKKLTKNATKNTLKTEFRRATQGLKAIEWFQKATALFDGEKYSDPNKALEYFTKSIDLDPGYALAYLGRSTTYALLKQYRNALNDLDHGIALAPNVALAYAMRASIFYELKNYPEAVKNYTQSILFDPKNADSYYYRGLSSFQLKQTQAAIGDLEIATTINPKNLKAFQFLAVLYNSLKQYNKVVKSLDAAIALDPVNSNNYSMRGATYSAIGHYQKAISDLDDAIILDKNNFSAYYDRGVAYLQLKQYQRAIVDLEFSLRNSPENANTYSILGITYLISGDRELGCKNLGQACVLGFCAGLENARSHNMCK
jgi:tetratricopeptide (TPR) repeat protein